MRTQTVGISQSILNRVDYFCPCILRAHGITKNYLYMCACRHTQGMRARRAAAQAKATPFAPRTTATAMNL